jgi:hypothetical protein
LEYHQSRNVHENKGTYSKKAGMFMKNKPFIGHERLCAERAASALRGRAFGMQTWDASTGAGGESKIFNIENEGESHDIIENKGRNFRTHDVYDN